MNSEVTQYPIVIEQQVVWGDMDAFQHVNNSVYFRYFEDARMAYFERAQVMQWMKEHSKGPILGSTQCRFRAPLTYPDRITIGARIESMGQDRFVMKYRVWSEKLDCLAAEGEGVIVYFDYEVGAKCTIPDSIRAMIVDVEQSVGHSIDQE
ncbi:acyl-CoA thioesterase [Aestuariirhabdus sp. Z084]|uniref:acyl-CoA thioesterase n=1 Tax=Aestuariirhabdus haliotis TaxID=2918751 RepID=UPI00201B447A|nr:thioesterase family protein [Aestuariirhabdus haliotis]MCL6417313.1 acyl-CoA thioesterase [Aestuariirhabdus haliotis]MCL6421258.1 acyl-CoA thioesterase [Aestuariirhabdus haliotis]